MNIRNDDDQKKVFSKNLLKYLNLYGKTQKEVADAICVSAQTFNTWCRCVALPRFGKVQLLADYFKISPSDLLDETPLDSLILSDREISLIKNFRKLNETDKAKVEGFVSLSAISIPPGSELSKEA